MLGVEKVLKYLPDVGYEQAAILENFKPATEANLTIIEIPSNIGSGSPGGLASNGGLFAIKGGLVLGWVDNHGR